MGRLRNAIQLRCSRLSVSMTACPLCYSQISWSSFGTEDCVGSFAQRRDLGLGVTGAIDGDDDLAAIGGSVRRSATASSGLEGRASLLALEG